MINRRTFLSHIGQASLIPIISQWSSLGWTAADSFSTLTGKLNGQMLTPQSPGYSDARLVYSKRAVSAPRAIVQAQTESDIMYTLDYCLKNATPLHIRGGGHSYEGWSTGGGLLLDLALFKSFSVGQKNQIHVGAGWRLGEVINNLKPSRLMIPTGSCPTVGVSGLTLGGGYGLSSRYLGLTCDRVRRMKVITADGRALWIDKNNSSELFWGMKGAGNGQLAMATEFEFEAFPIRPVQVFNFKIDARDWKYAFAIWQNALKDLPSTINPLFTLGTSGGRVTMARLAGLSWGTRVELQTFLNKFNEVKRGVGSPNIESYATDYYTSFENFAGGPSPRQAWFKCKSDYVYQDWTTIDLAQLEFAIAEASVPSLALLFDPYGGAIAKKARTDTAFVHRDAHYSIQYYAVFNQAAQQKVTETNLRKLYQLTRSLVSGEAYVNYCDLDLTQPLNAYYAENKTRLLALKKKVDPFNLFKHAQSLGSLTE